MSSTPEPAPRSPQQVLELWLERDLSEACAGLPAAHAIEAELEHAAGILAGGRNLLLIGDAGVGKTALVTALARHARAGGSDAPFTGHVLQLSVGLRLSRLRKEESIFEAFAALADALARLGEAIVVFIRDGDLLYQTGLAAQLDSFCLRQPYPVIAEGRPTAMNTMLEVYEEIEQHFVTLTLEEPGADRALRMLEGWAADPNVEAALQGDRRIDPGALEEAVYLTHRFLARTRLPRKAIDLLRASAAAAPGPVDAARVIDRFCRVHSTPRWLVDPDEPMALDELEDRYRETLLGQEEAVHATLATVATIKAGLSDVRRPFGVFLFVGPTGVGKTHLAQMLADDLFGAPERMVRINMGDFASARGAEALFGDPEHHLAANRRGVLTQRLTGRPFGVLLLDEFEKAHAAVHDRLLPVIDEGSFTNGAGESVSCRSSIIIATSNAGAEVYRESALGFTTPSDLDTKRDELDRRVREIFRFELLNRFDRVVHFLPLTRDEIRLLAARELSALEHRPGLRRRGARLDVDEAVLDWLAARGYDARYGARFLKRTIEREVTGAVADAIARSPLRKGETIALELRRGRVRARRADPAPRQPAALSANRPADTEGLGAQALLERARPRLDALDREIRERDHLLRDMAEPDLWSDAERRDAVTERFRTLDVSTRLVSRIARPLARLRAAMESGDGVDDALVIDAARALADWEKRDHTEGVGHLWLLVSTVHPDSVPLEWMRRLTRMLLAWCRRSDLRATPVAFEPRPGDGFARIALEVEGPGAEHFLAAERGVHRLRRSTGSDPQARVDLVPHQAQGAVVDVRDRPLLRGPFGLMAELEASVSLPHTGQNITLAAASRATLGDLVGDLQAAWSGVRSDSPELARSYGEAGGVVVDPRTGVSQPQRAVERGQLRAFMDAFERHRQGTADQETG